MKAARRGLEAVRRRRGMEAGGGHEDEEAAQLAATRRTREERTALLAVEHVGEQNTSSQVWFLFVLDVYIYFAYVFSNPL